MVPVAYGTAPVRGLGTARDAPFCYTVVSTRYTRAAKLRTSALQEPAEPGTTQPRTRPHSA